MFKTVVSYTRPGFSMTVRLHQLYVTITRNLCTFSVHPKFKGVQRIFIFFGGGDKWTNLGPLGRVYAARPKGPRLREMGPRGNKEFLVWGGDGPPFPFPPLHADAEIVYIC